MKNAKYKVQHTSRYPLPRKAHVEKHFAFCILHFILCISPSALLILAPYSPALAGDFPLNLTDALGHTVTLNASPKRIVSLAPSNTEILYAIGAGNRVVGVTSYCNYPDGAAQKPQVGGFSNPNLEQIVSLRPDLVLAARFNPMDVLEALRRLNISVFALAPATIAEALQTLRTVGLLTGELTSAVQLEAALQARFQTIEQTVAAIPETHRPRVLWGRLEAPMYTAGPGSFIGSLIRLAGGTNIAADADADWIQIGLETIVARNPQVIIVSDHTPGDVEKSLDRLRKTPGWKTVDAIASGHVYSINLDLLGRPGPRLIDGLEALAHTLHPHRFHP